MIATMIMMVSIIMRMKAIIIMMMTLVAKIMMTMMMANRPGVKNARLLRKYYIYEEATKTLNTKPKKRLLYVQFDIEVHHHDLEILKSKEIYQ